MLTLSDEIGQMLQWLSFLSEYQLYILSDMNIDVFEYVIITHLHRLTLTCRIPIIYYQSLVDQHAYHSATLIYHIYTKSTSKISIYTLGDLGDLRNLIGSLLR